MKTFPLTPEQFNELRTRLLEQGITLPAGDDGEIEFRGIRLKYHYDGTRLTLSILQKPFIISNTMIWDNVSRWLQA